MSNPRITLADYELENAAFVGMRRQASARINQRVARGGMSEQDGWGNHVEGACGEYAAARFLNVCWTGSVGTFGEDLKPNIEVKTRSNHSYDLLIRNNEDLDKIFILVTGTAPHFWVRGWAVGKHVVSDKWIKYYGNRPGAWFIPVSELSTDWLELKKTYIWK